MCYMGTRALVAGPAVARPAQPRVGVRELRQNLSVYLEQVAGGTCFEVTERGRVVAMLIPVSPAASLVERLVSQGRAIPARRAPASLRAARPVSVTTRQHRRIWAALDEVREDRL
jgi:prevent-host-death family protein